MNNLTSYKSLSRLVYLAAGLFLAIWFAYEVIQVIILVFFAIVITIVLNAPVTWLQKKMSRTAAGLLVFFGMLALFALVGWMVIPKIITQLKLLIIQTPGFLENLNQRITGWIGDHGIDNSKLIPSASSVTDQVSGLLNNIGRYSMSLIGNIFMTIFFFCLVG